jgi:hypothetical protein
MELHVLPGRYMRAGRLSVEFGDIRQDVQLIRVQVPPLDFDPDHVFVGGSPDAVDTIFQAEAFEIIRIHAARFELADICLKRRQFRFLNRCQGMFLKKRFVLHEHG